MYRFFFVIFLLLAGCALIPHLEPGQSQDQVRHELGAPSRVVTEANGGTRWMYANQPFGTTFINARFNAEGRLTEFWDGLDDKHLADIRVGMSMDEVADHLGPYRTEVYFSLSKETVRDWNVNNQTGPGIATLFNVHFKDGLVVRTSMSYVYPRDVKFLGSGFGGFHMGSGGWGAGVGIGF
jgi:outer membrane protein assembly factor BamE (lipoprotein component of BamABCDE complex)